MNKKTNIDLLVTVAKMYFLDGLKQDEIAKKVNVSRSLISLILTEAKDLGIVSISIHDPRESDETLAQLFLERFRLDRCFVVPTSMTDPDYRLKLTVGKGIDIFNREVGRGDTIGIAWGKTCYQFMSQFDGGAAVDELRVVPLVGSSDRSLQRYQMNEVVRQFAEKVHGNAQFIHAPAYPVSKRDYELYMESSTVKSISQAWKNIDIAIISFGAPPRQYSDNVAESIAQGGERTAEIAERAVGDACARFFDGEGNFIEDEIGGITIAIPEKNLRSAKKCICIVSGDNKISSIIGGLKTGIADTLVIDETTARMVIHSLEKELKI